MTVQILKHLLVVSVLLLLSSLHSCKGVVPPTAAALDFNGGPLDQNFGDINHTISTPPLKHPQYYEILKEPLVYDRQQGDGKLSPLPKLNCGWGTARKEKEPYGGRIIDITIFTGDDWDLLEARFYELHEVVDIFVVVEDDLAMTGEMKVRRFPYLYDQRLLNFRDKIVYIHNKINRDKCLNDLLRHTGGASNKTLYHLTVGQCKNDYKNAIMELIPGGIKASDIIHMSDVEEVVSLEWFRTLRLCDFNDLAVKFRSTNFYYSLHWTVKGDVNPNPNPNANQVSSSERTHHNEHVYNRHGSSTACRGSFILAHGNKLSKCIHSKDNKYVTDSNSHGWNMRYFNSVHTIRKKLGEMTDRSISLSHVNDIDKINDHAYSGKDLFNRGKHFELEYRSTDEVDGPWFYMANKPHRPIFHRYGKASDHKDVDLRPHCLALNEVVGGLGNQMFGIGGVLMRAYRLGVPYTLPLHMTMASKVSPTYWSTPLMQYLVENSFNRSDCKGPFTPEGSGVGQPIHWRIKDIASHSVEYHGYCMHGQDILGFDSHIRQTFLGVEALEWKLENKERILMIGYRSFLEEHHPEWAVPFHYYLDALKKVLRDDHVIHIFGDQGVQNFANELKKAANLKNTIVVTPGKRDNWDTAIHMQHMMQCDDFILSISSFHWYGAFMSTSSDKKVVYPLHPKYDWMLRFMPMPPHSPKWIAVTARHGERNV